MARARSFGLSGEVARRAYEGGLVRRIEEWLGNLGLDEYALRFVENDIDLSIVRDLSDQDLKELGVASLGHRRKLLRAISELDASPADAVSAVKPQISPPEG